MKKIIFVFVAVLTLASCERSYLTEYVLVNDCNIDLTIKLGDNNDITATIEPGKEFILYYGEESSFGSNAPFQEYETVTVIFGSERYIEFCKGADNNQLFDKNEYEWETLKKKYIATYRFTPEMYEEATHIEL